MTAENKSAISSLLIIDSDPRARAYVKKCFADRDVRVIGGVDDVKSGLRIVRGARPDLVLMELPENATETMQAVAAIREEFPDIGIILSRHDPPPALILSAMRVGAQEFVGRPLDAPEIGRAVANVRRLMKRTIAVQRNRGTVLSVFSPKGGIGSTSVATNLAVALAGQKDIKAALVDLSFQMGDLGLMLDEPPQYSLADAFVDGKIDETKLRSVLTHHESGVSLLTVAPSPEVGEGITRDHMVELFGTLSALFDFVIVDIGRQLDDRTIEVLDISDDIVMLTTLDVPTIRNVSRYLDIFDRLELKREDIHLVVNRFHKKTRLGLKDLESALGMKSFWNIPNDFNQVSLGIDEGKPVVLKSPRSKIAQSYKQFAEHLCSRRMSPRLPAKQKAIEPARTPLVKSKEMAAPPKEGESNYPWVPGVDIGMSR